MRQGLTFSVSLTFLAWITIALAETTPAPPVAVTQRVEQLLLADKLPEAENEFEQYYSNIPLSQREAIVQASLKLEAAALAERLDKLGLASEANGRHDDANLLFEKALHLREHFFGKDTGVAQSLNNIALVLLNQGKYQEAEPLLRDAIALREKLQSPQTADLVPPLVTLGAVLASEKRFDEAEAVWQRALTISGNDVGGNVQERVVLLRNLARLYTNEGKPDQAQAALLEVSRLQQQGPK